MWIKCGDGAHLLNASQVLHFNVEAASDAHHQTGADGPGTESQDSHGAHHGLPESGVLVVAWMVHGEPVCVGRYETQDNANLVLNTILAAFESGSRTLDVHRLRTGRRGADSG